MDIREIGAPYLEPDRPQEEMEETNYLENMDTAELTPKALNQVQGFFEGVLEISKQIKKI